MEVLAVSDQRGMALVEHARIERLLKDDLGLLPDATTRALAERIKRGQTRRPRRQTRALSEAREAGPAMGKHLASLGRSPSPLIRPRVIVCAFDNLTGRRRYGDMAHAVTQDVASAIAGDHLLDVSFANGHRGMGPVDAAYAISGSLRSHGDGVRIVAQLTSESTGRLLWSKSFDEASEPPLCRRDRRCAQIAARVSHAVRSARPPGPNESRPTVSAFITCACKRLR